MAGRLAVADMQDFMELVNGQDRRIVDLVQRGAGSAHAEPGLLSPKESALVEFYAYVRRNTGPAVAPAPR